MPVLFDGNEPTCAMLEEGAQLAAKMPMGFIKILLLPCVVLFPLFSMVGVLVQEGGAVNALLALVTSLTVYGISWKNEQALLGTVGAFIMRGAAETSEIKPTVIANV